MEKNQVLEAIRILRDSEKRKFRQKFDLIVNLKNMDIKKENERLNIFHTLPHLTGREVKICALVSQELSKTAKTNCNHVILLENFPSPKDKKAIKKLAGEYDFFIAQANIMAQVAGAFGKVLGPRGKMPNPKAGCVIPPTMQDMKEVVEKLKRTVRLETKNELIIRALVGSEDMKDEDIAENVLSVYNTILHAVPQEKNNIKNVILKMTMSKPVVIGAIAQTAQTPVIKKEVRKK